MKKFILYRHFDKEKNLLYVGRSSSFSARWMSHRSRSPWFNEIVVVTIEHFENANLLACAEIKAIINENPKYNKASLPPKDVSYKKTEEYSEKSEFGLDVKKIEFEIKNKKLKNWLGLSKKMNVSRQWISQVKLNKSHTLKTITKIAEGLGVDPKELLI